MKFGYILRNLRAEKNITGEQLGKILGVPKATVANWETGRNYPNQAVLEKIADYFDVSLDYLMGRTDIKKPAPDNFQFAFSDYEKLTDEQKEIIKNLAASLIAQNEKK